MAGFVSRFIDSFSIVECFRCSYSICFIIFFLDCCLLFFIIIFALLCLVINFELLEVKLFIAVFTCFDVVMVVLRNHNLSSLVAFSFFCEQELGSQLDSNFDKVVD